MSHRVKTCIFIGCDIVCFLTSIVLAFMLRFEFRLARALPYTDILLTRLPALLVVRLACYTAFGLYNRLWQFASVRELLAVAEAGTLASAWDYLLLRVIPGAGFPRSVLLLTWILNILLVGGARFVARLRREWLMGSTAGARGVLGSGTGGTREGEGGGRGP